MYLFPQPPPRRRASPGLGAVRVARLPLTPQMLARGLSVRGGVVAPASGYILSASLRAPASSRPVFGKPGKAYDIPGAQPGGVPFADAPRRQAGAFTQIGPGSMSSPAAAGQFQIRRRRSFSLGLGAITVDQAAEQIFPQARVGKRAGHNQGARDAMLASIQAGQLVGGQTGQNTLIDYVPGTGSCAGVKGSVKPAVMSTIGGTAIKFAAATGPAAPFVLAAGIVLDAAGFITGIFTHHHQQAVAKERGTLCVEVPAANNALQAIDAAVQQGQMTPAQAQDALDSLVANFRTGVAGIIHGSDPMSSGECNAACVELSKLRAICAYKKSQYVDLAAQQASPVAAAAQSLGLPSNLPAWVLPAAAFGILWWAL